MSRVAKNDEDPCLVTESPYQPFLLWSSVNKSYVYEINDCFNEIMIFSFTMNRNLCHMCVIKPQDD